MLKLILISLFSIATVYGHGQWTVVSHPVSLVFKGHERLKESELPEVFSASLGYSINRDSEWEGCYIVDPFNLAQVIATVTVDGVPSTNFPKGHHFPLTTNIYDDGKIYQNIYKRVVEHYPDSSTNSKRIDLANGLLVQSSVFKSIKSDKPKKSVYTHLDLKVDEDREFLKEVDLFDAIIDMIEKKSVLKDDNTPKVLWFRFGSLHAIADLYGENSTHTKEAKQVLNEKIERFNTVLKKVFDGKCLVSIIASDAVHTRLRRNILADDPANKFDNLNLAKNYNANYPVMFNIILWFGVAMFFSLLAICYAIGNMDPGRDSIIYRMTSTRMKKDN